MKVTKFLISLFMMILFALLLSISDITWPEKKKDYTGLTEKSYPDIAIDFNFNKEYPKWKLSRKRLSNRR